MNRPDPDIWTVSNVLSPEECETLITRGEATGFEVASVRTPDGPQMIRAIRNNDRVVFEDAALAQMLWARVRELVPPEMDGCRVAGLYSLFRFYRYDPGQRFKRHKDGREKSASGEESRFSFLIYLNSGYEGGETVFRDYTFSEGKSSAHEIPIVPEVGLGLFFLHERWHEGTEVTTGRKYVLRTDVLYRPAGLRE